MSYSNPKIYLQDPLAFANSFKEAFQSSFQGVEDHIATVRSQVEQKNKARRAQGLREAPGFRVCFRIEEFQSLYLRRKNMHVAPLFMS